MVVVHGRPVYALTQKSIITLPNTPFKLTWKKLRCNFDMYMSRATKTIVSEVKPKARESRYIKLKAVWKFDEYNIQSYLDINVLKAEMWNGRKHGCGLPSPAQLSDWIISCDTNIYKLPSL